MGKAPSGKTKQSSPKNGRSNNNNNGNKKVKDVDDEVVKEFGGPIGCIALMIFSHAFIYYVWICLEFNNGSILYPESMSDIFPFFERIFGYLKEKAIPNESSIAIYGGFMLFQAILALTMPGLQIKGLPVPSEGNKQLIYNCNGVASWYVTLATVVILHYTGIFSLSSVQHNFGSLITTAMLFADIFSIFAHITALIKKKAVRMSGNVIYDFFMGAWLNPRPIGNFDLKFWAETRVAWIMLWLLTASAAVSQWEQTGTVSYGLIFMLIAHGLYTNACMKGEECIPTTWDVFYEKWGWMLIFWNFAGVPFFYCAQSVFLMKHPEIQISRNHFFILLAILLFAYYIWDTSQSQRNRFRMKLRGTYKPRYAFPQLPWGTLENPKYLTTKCGGTLLVDGWWKYARKIHYTCDVVMGLTWGLACGFTHFLPFLYVSFFTSMIIHRYSRDVHRCSRKYGSDW
ncbi:MAG: delta(24(24(1)))-sterol reductase, partial [Legionellales bacterium RIFCSPHIGHO2_12_FULL_35_11]